MFKVNNKYIERRHLRRSVLKAAIKARTESSSAHSKATNQHDSNIYALKEELQKKK